MIWVEPVSTTLAPRTASSSTRTPSTTTQREPMKAPSSITTDIAPRGSSTPPLAPPPAPPPARADEAPVLDHDGHSPWRLQHAADADAPCQVHAPSDLGP